MRRTRNRDWLQGFADCFWPAIVDNVDGLMKATRRWPCNDDIVILACVSGACGAILGGENSFLFRDGFLEPQGMVHLPDAIVFPMLIGATRDNETHMSIYCSQNVDRVIECCLGCDEERLELEAHVAVHCARVTDSITGPLESAR